MKNVGIVVAFALLGFVVFKSMSGDPSPEPVEPTAAPVEAKTTKAASLPAGLPDPALGLPGEDEEDVPQPPPDAIGFDRLPADHAAEVVRGKVGTLGAAIADRFEVANVEMLEPECESAPCILGFDYDAAAVASSEFGARAFHQGVRDAFEETLGYPVTSMHIDEIEGGKQIWMFAVPPSVAKDDPLRNQLIETGHHRHAVLLGELPGAEDEAGDTPEE